MGTINHPRIYADYQQIGTNSLRLPLGANCFWVLAHDAYFKAFHLLGLQTFQAVIIITIGKCTTHLQRERERELFVENCAQLLVKLSLFGLKGA